MPPAHPESDRGLCLREYARLSEEIGVKLRPEEEAQLASAADTPLEQLKALLLIQLAKKNFAGYPDFRGQQARLMWELLSDANIAQQSSSAGGSLLISNAPAVTAAAASAGKEAKSWQQQQQQQRLIAKSLTAAQIIRCLNIAYTAAERFAGARRCWCSTL